MQPRNIAFLKSQEIASATIAFYFEKPADFVHKAGQYMDLALINPPETDAEGDVRTFSIASAPHEPELMIATRIRTSAFKRVLRQMKVGDPIELRSMGGSFTLHNKAERAAVFIAGGIGITPFRSMIVDAIHRNLPYRIVLFLSNRTPAEAAFLTEMQGLADQHPTFTFVPVMTEAQGYLTAAMVQAHTKDLAQPIYYIAGSMGMVQAMRDMLTASGVDDDDIRSEDFPGY